MREVVTGGRLPAGVEAGPAEGAAGGGSLAGGPCGCPGRGGGAGQAGRGQQAWATYPGTGTGGR